MSTDRPQVASFTDLLVRARALAPASGRAVIGIAGAPGAGKSTLAEALVAALAAEPPPDEGPDWVAHVPMDGYHLADVELARLGRAGRKGAPDTFDAAGYAALLRRLVEGDPGTDETVYAPAFDHLLGQPVAGAVPVGPRCRLVVSEGNYLLLDQPEWRRARALLREVWSCELDDRVRLDRLLDRHVRAGRERDDAQAWMRSTDEPNARLVSAAAGGADVVVLPSAVPPPVVVPPVVPPPAAAAGERVV